MIDEEIKKVKAGQKGYIGCKMNSLTDKLIIDKLVEASKAGVKVELLVRGISCLIPGVEGETDNIHVYSIVGRFLEHSRIYIFGKKDPKVYISSADFMTRNTIRRVEVALSILDNDIKEKIAEKLKNVKKSFGNNLNDELNDIMANIKLTDYYKRLAKTLEINDPKHPEDIFKSHLEDKKSNEKKLESYKINMAVSIASSFINAGFSNELLLSKDNEWINKNKEEGLSSLIAGLGLIHLWDTIEGPGKLYEYANNSEKDLDKRSGRNIGLGICYTGIHDDNDTAIAALIDELQDKNLKVKILNNQFTSNKFPKAQPKSNNTPKDIHYLF